MSFFDMLEELQKPQVQQKPWMADVDLRLATVQDLDAIAQECIAAGHYGLDLESTGLDQRTFEGANGRKEIVDKITGFCIAPTINKGWYIPVRHTGAGSSANVPIRLVADMLRKIQAGGAKAIFHNGKFDQKLLDFDPIGAIGDWDNIDLWEDTLILAYLNDARAKNKGLKFLAKSLLDREMIELEQLFSPEEVKAKKLDFSTLDPAWPPVVWYAAADSVNTLALFYKLHASVVDKDEHGNSQKAIYRIEKACLRATLWMEDCRIYINREKLEDLIRLGQKEWWDCVNEVYDEACTLLRRDVRPHWLRSMRAQGYDPNQLDPNYMEVRDLAQSGSQDDTLPLEEKSVPRLDDPRKQESVKFPKVYDVTIPASLGQMLREAGVRGLAVTEKSNQVKTSKDELDRVIDEAGTDFPFMVKIKRFREVAKGLGTNLYPIWWDTTSKRAPDGSVWASFNGFKVDTGRFSTPTPLDKNRDHFHGQIRWGVHMTPATYDPTKPECVRRTRECVAARPGFILVAVDYSGVELRIVTNLAGEPKWITEFFRCSGCDHTFDKAGPIPPFCPHCGSDKIGDLHTLTAISVFGEHIKGTDEFKQRRQEAKCVYLDTEIVTPSGPVRMGDLPFGPVDTFSPVDGVYVLGPKGEYIHVLETYNGGVKPLYQVVSESATLTCSAEHRFLLEDGSLQSISEGLGVGSFVQGAHGEIREILQVVPVGEHLCVDLHIDSDDHLYMANGFVTHNSLNFAMCYGGGGSAAQRAVGVNQEEGWRIKNQFDKTYKILQKWWDSQHRTARKQKYVTTAFGRKYPLPDIDHTDGGFRSKAERNSVNGPVQGCLHPDARIVTRNGLCTIRDLWDGVISGERPSRFDIWTGSMWSEARPLFSGLKPHVTTVFEDGGRIDTSPDHLFRTWRDGCFSWVRQADLQEGDWVARDTYVVDFPEPRYVFKDPGASHNAVGFTFDGNSEILWELLGRVIGDGSIRNDGVIVYIGEAPQSLSYEAAACGYSAETHARSFAERVSKGLGVKVGVKEKRRGAEDSRRNIWSVSLHNNAFVRFCQTVLGLSRANTLDKSFPSAVWCETLQNRAAFLRGYFDADGTVSRSAGAVSVRSANVGLLRETYALLRSVGVRAALRETSHRVSVLDRDAFRERIGFTVEYKVARIWGLTHNPQMGRNVRIPPDIVSAVGYGIYHSAEYAHLPRAKKSAVLRLCMGSGSKVQCENLMGLCGMSPPEEFIYDYTRVVGKIDHRTSIEMYDIEVFDDLHAFVADGVVVHNSSADIMKLAMALLYKDFKARGWVASGRVKMIITIHDELVFEIQEENAGEVIDVIQRIMTQDASKALGWLVPLTVDIEFGDDWTVPYHLTKMAWNKSKDNKWSERWVRAFPSHYQHYLKCGGTPVDGAPPPSENGSNTPPEPKKDVPPTPAQAAVEKEGSTYVYRVSRLTAASAEKLARVIHKCVDRGLDSLHIRDVDGNDLFGGPLQVAYEEFRVVADYEGLR